MKTPKLPAWRRYRELLGPNPERDLRDELRFHLETETEELIAAGLSPDEARRQALARFGDVDGAIAACRDSDRRRMSRRHRSVFLDALEQDVRYAARTLRKQPVFAATVVLSLALGIGLVTSIFTVADSLVRHPLPYRGASTIVTVGRIAYKESNGSGSRDPTWTLFGNDIGAWHDRTRTLAAMAVFSDAFRTVQGRGDAEYARGGLASTDLLRVLGTRPELGRWFAKGEGREHVVVLSVDLWRRQFGGDTSAIGAKLDVDGVPWTVIGVLRPDQGLPIGAAFWMPASENETELFGQLVARPRNSATPQSIAAELDALSSAASTMRRRGYRVQYRVVPLEEQLFGSARPALRLLAIAAALLFITACANVASLTLARALERRRELGVRIALGASRRSLIGLVLIENGILAAAGALLALAFAALGIRAVLAFGPPELTLGMNFTLRNAGIASAAVLGAVAAFAVSLAPILVAGRRGAQPLFTAGGAQAARGRASSRARRGLVVVQLAVALLLITSSGLLLRSIANLTGTGRLGFNPSGTVVASLRMTGPSWRDANHRTTVVNEIMRRLRSLPGVRSTAYGPPPLVAGRGDGVREGFDALVSLGGASDAHAQVTWVKRVDAGYIDTYGIRVVSGRGFTPTDSSSAEPAAVLNATAARLLFGTIDAVGKTLALPASLTDSGAPPARVIGVVADALQRDPTMDAAPELLLYARTKGMTPPTFAVRSNAPSRVVIAQVGQLLRDVDPSLAPSRLESMTEVVDASLSRHRFLAFLLGLFSGLALTLAAIGLYAVVSYLVSQRRVEIGIRLALGAQRSEMFRLVVSEGLVLVAMGAVIGTLGALLSSRLLSSFIYDVSEHDLSTYVAAPAVLAIVAIAAMTVPALRAARVDPALAVRAD